MSSWADSGGPTYTNVQRNLALELVRVTEAAALASGKWFGKARPGASPLCWCQAANAGRLVILVWKGEAYAAASRNGVYLHPTGLWGHGRAVRNWVACHNPSCAPALRQQCKNSCAAVLRAGSSAAQTRLAQARLHHTRTRHWRGNKIIMQAGHSQTHGCLMPGAAGAGRATRMRRTRRQ